MKLVQYPDLILTTPTEQVEDFAEARQIAFQMSTAYLRNMPELVGLAANQIGIPKAICIISYEGHWLKMVNPKIVEYGIKRETEVEGCGSLQDPPILVAVSRPVDVTIIYQTLNKAPIEIKLSGFDARVAQHEIDHLNGHLTIDFGEVVDSPT